MKKPFIYIHCLTSLDGKLMGNYMKLPEETAVAPWFKEIGFGGKVYPVRAMLNGTNTCASDYTYNRKPVLDPEALTVPEGDYVSPNKAERYLVALDRKGKLGWERNFVPYAGVEQRIISVLTKKASNAYKALLRDLDIAYVICGDEEIDFDLLFEKLVDLFDIDCLKVGGGGTINWTLLRGGYVDEVSYVIAPAADGSTETPQLFMSTPGNNEDIPVSFELVSCEADMETGGVWLRYKVNKVWDADRFENEIGTAPKDFIAVDNKGNDAEAPASSDAAPSGVSASNVSKEVEDERARSFDDFLKLQKMLEEFDV